MNNLLDMYKNALQTIGLEMLIINFVVTAGIVLIYRRVFINFKDAKKQREQKQKEVKSIVETASMSAFFLVCSIIVLSRIGIYTFHSTLLNVIALLVYLLGVFVNLQGRENLGKNWGNNVVIYKDHTLVTNGVYRFVRHPLYASIIWMIYAVSVVYQNYLVAILNTIIFIPFMAYRAKQEEKELIKIFGEYERYKKSVGMFFPKILKRKKEN